MVGLFLMGAASNLRYLANLSAPAHGPDPPGREGFRDFRDATYTPVRDLLDGNNPYDHRGYLDRYPGQQEFDLYLPSWLTVHLPVAFLRYEVARAAYVALLLGASLVLAWAVVLTNGVSRSLLGAFGLGGAILLSLPGQAAIRTGQAVFVSIIGVVAALHLRHRSPPLAGLGLAAVMFKPQLGLPVAVLLWIGCRAGRAVRIGAAITALAAVPAVVALLVASGGPLPWVRSLVDNAAYSSRLYGDLGSPLLDRIDGAKVIGTLTGLNASVLLQFGVLILVLGPAAIVLRRSRAPRESALEPESVAVLCLATLAATPHFKYDAVLLVIPVVAVAMALRRALAPGRVLLLALMLIPFGHGLIVDRALHRLGFSAAMTAAIDSAAILVGFAVAIWLHERRSTALSPAT